MTAPYRLSTTAYSIYVQLPFRYGGRLLHPQTEYKPCRSAGWTQLLRHEDHLNTVQPGYNDIGLYDTSSITLDILCYQLIPHTVCSSVDVTAPYTYTCS
jgi:hypothetical protein